MFMNEYMHLAISAAEEAFYDDEIPVGAVIIDPVKKKIVASAYNLIETLQSPVAHAEILVIERACKSLSSKCLEGLDLYVTLQPCIMCMQAIIYAKIKRLYFGAYAPEVVYNTAFSNHEVEIYGGIEEEKCKKLLTDFFREKRTTNCNPDQLKFH